MHKWYISCSWCTVYVETGMSGRITSCAPVVGKFLGRKLEDLTRWLNADVVEEICKQ